VSFFRAVYSRSDLAFLLGLSLPLFAYALQTKIERIQTRGVSVGISDLPGLFGSDLAMHAAFVALGLTTFAVFWSRGMRALGKGLLQLYALLHAAVLLGAHGYFMSTGSSLDYPMLEFSLVHIDETAKVVASAGSTSRIVFFSTALVSIVALPWILARALRAAPRSPRLSDRWLCGLLSLAAYGSLLGAAMEVRSAYGADLARESLLNVAMTSSVGADDVDAETLSRAAKRPRGARRIAPRAEVAKKNVVVILLESTGLWATTLGDPAKATTPYLAELAKRSLWVQHMYAVVPHTSKALVSTLCGIEPRPGVGVAESRPGGIPGRCLPSLLRTQGYQSVMMQSATRKFEARPQLVRNMGFDALISGDEMDATGLEKANYFGYEDRIVLEPTRTWLKQRDPTRPFFYALLTNTPHHDYLPLEHYGTAWELDHPESRYLNSVRYQDFVLRDLMRIFEEEGVLDDTIFMILGDHGEGFGQHGRYAHDDTIYDEGLRIPFLIHEPGAERARGVLKGPFNELDVVPTLLDMLELEVTEGRFQGRSVFAPPAERVLYASCYNEHKCLARYAGSRKLVYHFGRSPSQLFDVEADPNELVDLADAHRAEVFAHEADAQRWYADLRAMYRAVTDRAAEGYVTRTRPEVAHPASIRFGDAVEYIGFNTSKERVSPGEWVDITYYFRVLDRVPQGYQLFTHAQDGFRKRIWDHPPVRGMYPPENWRPGEYVADEHGIRVPRDWATDKLRIHSGFWKPNEPHLVVDPPTPTDSALIVELPVVKER
jgi:hypothetical protein